MAWGAVGAVGSAISSPIAAHFAQKRQWKYVKSMMKNRHQWEVADLRAAGLNPILSALKQGPLGSVGIPSSGGGGDVVTSALKASRFKKEMIVLDAQADSLSSSALEARARAGEHQQRTLLLEVQTDEFKPTLGGIGRRLFTKENLKRGKDFLQAVGDVPDWIRQRIRAAAER